MYASIKHEVLNQLASMQDEISQLHQRIWKDARCFTKLGDAFGRLQQLPQAPPFCDCHDWIHDDPAVTEQIRQLRTIANHALCDYEKHQVSQLCQKEKCTNQYLHSLSHSLDTEIQHANIQPHATILLIGSGALPTTAFTLVTERNAQVVCYDHDPEAQQLAFQLVSRLGLQDSVTFMHQLPDLANYDFSHVIIASLVEDKTNLLREVTPYMRDGCKLVMRYGNGMKSIFNCPYQHHQHTAPWRRVGEAAMTPLYDLLVLEYAHE